MIPNKKIIFSLALYGGMLFMQSHAPKQDDHKPVNLQVLPKDISEHELHEVMRDYSRALGVRCNHCHAAEKKEGQERPKYDFASDSKTEKKTAREMMLMVNAINNNYLAKMTGNGQPLEKITCVTCHMGRTTPIITADSLVKKQ